MSARGALRFGRYAFPPNQLGYCGPDDHQALLEYVSEKKPDRGLVELERRFEGAYPYLCLIARANRIADPFDPRVVDGYWIGNRLLENVRAADFYESLRDRFRSKMLADQFRWMATKLEQGARPHHNFHVFEVYVRAGLMHDDRAVAALAPMDSCRISWGRVSAVEAAELVVDRQALELRDGKLALSEPRPVRVTRQVDGRGFVDAARPGDAISIHWSWACDLLDTGALRRLQASTQRYLSLANQTI